MTPNDISGESARNIARYFQDLYLSPETRLLLEQKSQQKGIKVNEMFAVAFLALWSDKKAINDTTLKECLTNLP